MSSPLQTQTPLTVTMMATSNCLTQQREVSSLRFQLGEQSYIHPHVGFKSALFLHTTCS